MASKRTRRGRRGGGGSEELYMTPMMNLFTVLIPFLLSCAAFASISIIEIKLPENRGASSGVKQTKRFDDQGEGLSLTVMITDKGLTLGARGGFLPTIFTKEKYEFQCNQCKTHSFFDIEIKQTKKNFFCTRCKKQLTLGERINIYVYVLDSQGDSPLPTLIQGVYDNANEAIADESGYVLKKMPVLNQRVMTLHGRQQSIVKNSNQFHLAPLSAYDELTSVLLKVKEKYQNAPDINDIIIAAEDDIIYDKVVQVMDMSLEAGFSGLSISKLRK